MSDENAIVCGNDVGKLFKEMEETVVIWKIPNFTKKLSDPPGTFYNSQTFVSSDLCWFLSIYPNGDGEEDSKDGIALGLCLEGEHRCSITCTLSIRNAKGVTELSQNFENDFDSSDLYYDNFGFNNFCKKSTLMNRKSELMSEDTLTIECRLKSNKSSLLGVSRIEQLLNLQSDLQKILTEKENCDVVFKVDGEEIEAHKLILMNRSEVFESMLSHGKTGKITVDDIEPDVFEEVLAYMYCGEVENLSIENMCQLYVAADKYHLDELKTLCATFIAENISLDVFCDIIAIPDTCIDAELMLLLKDFFRKNIRSIIDTEQWKTLHEKNTEVTYQLLLSTLKVNLEAHEATEVSLNQSKTDAAMKTIEDTAVSSVPSELEDEATEVILSQSKTDAAMQTIEYTAVSSVPSELEDEATEVSLSQSNTDAAMTTIEDTDVSSVPSELEDEATEVSFSQSETDAAMKTIEDTDISSVPSELEDEVTYGAEFGVMRESKFDVKFWWSLLALYGILFVLKGFSVFYP